VRRQLTLHQIITRLTLATNAPDPNRPSTLHRIAAGEPSAIKELTDRYGGLVYSLARRFSYESSEVEDAVQEIYVALWQSAARFNPELGAEETFVAMVARRRLIDRRRRATRRLSLTVDADVALLGEGGGERGTAVRGGGAAAEDGPDQPRPRTELSEDAQRAMHALKGLREEQQLVVRLAVLQSMSHEQISKATGMPLGTVKTHVRRGLIALRESMSHTEAMRNDDS